MSVSKLVVTAVSKQWHSLLPSLLTFPSFLPAASVGWYNRGKFELAKRSKVLFTMNQSKWQVHVWLSVCQYHGQRSLEKHLCKMPENCTGMPCNWHVCCRIKNKTKQQNHFLPSFSGFAASLCVWLKHSFQSSIEKVLLSVAEDSRWQRCPWFWNNS